MLKKFLVLSLTVLVLGVVAVAAQETPEPPQPAAPSSPPPPATPPEQPATPEAAEAPPAEPPPNPDLEEAKLLFRKGDYVGAAASAEKVLATQDKEITSLYIAGVSLLRLGRLDAAERYLNTLKAVEPNMPNLFFHLGHLAFSRADEAVKTGRPDEGRELYLRAAEEFRAELARDPNQKQALSSLPAALARGGKIEDAIQAYEAWIASAPEAIAPYTSLGNLLAELGRTEDAMAVVERMPKQNTAAVHDAAYGMARILYLREQHQDVLTFLEKEVFPRDPESKQGWGLRTATLARLGRIDDAAPALCHYVALNPPEDEAAVVGEVVKKQFGGPPEEEKGMSSRDRRNTPAGIWKAATPRYPEQARKDRIETQVLYLVKIKADSLPADICLVPSSFWKSVREMGFEEAALDAVKRSKYRAALKNGAPADSYLAVPVDFKLR